MSQIGHYEILEPIGDGVLGSVYRAFDTSARRVVALKVLHLDRLYDVSSSEMEKRFRDQYDKVVRLSHPGIAQIYQVEREGSKAHIAMELVQGPSLAVYVRERNGIAIAATVTAMSQMLDALAYAHERSVVHRDIKPSNLIVGRDGHIKITDFGMTELAARNQVETGLLVGSMQYMAPEQFRDAPVDARCDIHAAGTIMYELLTGRSPFADTLGFAMHDICTLVPPAPSKAKAGVTPVFDAIVARALAKKPDGRYANARDFRTAIRVAYQRLSGAEPPETLPPPVAATAAQPNAHERETGVRQRPPIPATREAPMPASGTAAGTPTVDARPALKTVPAPSAPPAPRTDPTPPAPRVAPASPSAGVATQRIRLDPPLPPAAADRAGGSAPVALSKQSPARPPAVAVNKGLGAAPEEPARGAGIGRIEREPDRRVPKAAEPIARSGAAAPGDRAKRPAPARPEPTAGKPAQTPTQAPARASKRSETSPSGPPASAAVAGSPSPPGASAVPDQAILRPRRESPPAAASPPPAAHADPALSAITPDRSARIDQTRAFGSAKQGLAPTPNPSGELPVDGRQPAVAALPPAAPMPEAGASAPPSAPAAGARAGEPGGRLVVLLTEDTIALGGRVLAHYVGPIAVVLSRRAAKEAHDVEHYFSLLAAHVGSLSERLKFLREVGGRPR